MRSELAGLVESCEYARDEVTRLAGEYSAEEWSRRPLAEAWSAAECIAHLNLTSAAYEPRVEEALQEARAKGRPSPDRLRLDLLGWLVYRSIRPTSKMRARTSARFEPVNAGGRDLQVAEFSEWQEKQIEWIRSADGLPIHRVKMASPFADRVRYSLYSGLVALVTHQLRHIAQAERALAAARANADRTGG